MHDPRRRSLVGHRDPADDQVQEPAAHDLGVVTEAPARVAAALHAHARQGPHHVRLRLPGALDASVPRRGAALDLRDDVRDAWLYDNADAFFFAPDTDQGWRPDGLPCRSTPTTTTTSRSTPSPGTSTRSSRERGVQPVQDGKRVELLIGGKVNRFIPNPTFDPIIVPGLPRPAVPRPDPRGRRPADADAGRAAARRVPRPRRALKVAGRAGARRGAAVPHARLRRRGGAQRRHPRDDGQPVGLQPLARGGLGLRLRGPAHRRADALARRPRRRRWPRSTRSIERGARMVHVRPAPVPGPNGTQPLARRQAPRPGVGAPRRGVDPGRVPPRRQRLQRRSPRCGAAAPPSGFGEQRPARAACSCPTAPSTTRSPRSSSTACSPATRRCASPASRTAPTGWRCWSSGCASRPTRRRGSSPETRSTRSAATSGSRPTTRRTSTTLAELIGVERILFGSDWPHGEGLAEPLDFVEELDGFDDGRGAADHARQLPRAARARRPGERPGPASTRPTTTSSGEVAGLARRATGTRSSTVDEWWRIVAEAGWTAPHFTPEQGGRGLRAARAGGRCASTFARVGALRPPGGLGLLMAAPTILTHGTADQIARLVAADPRRPRRAGASCSASPAPAPTSPA